MIILELKNKIIELYDDYSLFSIVLFTSRDPTVIKMFEDKHYYKALDEISGDRIAIFTTRLLEGKYKQSTFNSPNGFASIIPIWQEPEKNIELLNFFDIKNSEQLPLIVFFSADEKEFYFSSYKINGSSTDAVFNSLEKIIISVSDSTSKYNALSKRELFKKIKWKIKKINTVNQIKNFLQTISLLRGSIGP